MAETRRRGAITAPGGRRRGELPDPVPDHLPFARAASVIAVVVLAGALFGYDQGVISGALLGIQKEFAVGAIALEIVTGWVTLGAMFGSLAAGFVADHFGRKRALLAAAGLRSSPHAGSPRARVRATLADPAQDRPRPRGLATDHRNQRGHLLFVPSARS
jgi:hypothetical protein